MDNKDDKQLKEIRKRIFLMAYKAGIGHLASSYSMLEIMYVLYLKNVMKYDSKNINWDERDKLVLSKGHGSLALYNVLSLAGYFDEKYLMTFSQPGTILGGEPNKLEVPGVEASTGSLGHGLSLGEGIALADKMNGKDCKTYVILGDGECQEGSIWEAAMFGAQLQLENLIVILDNNRIQKMGFTKEIMGEENWKAKWESFGWKVTETDGHEVDKLYDCLTNLKPEGMPQVVIAKTIKGHGVSIMENNPSWHWRLPSKKEMKIVIQELEITEEELDACKKLI